ncbi:MAG: hypothetical protein ACRELY_30590, partial [Polyangiaceae bacterium]
MGEAALDIDSALKIATNEESDRAGLLFARIRVVGVTIWAAWITAASRAGIHAAMQTAAYVLYVYLAVSVALLAAARYPIVRRELHLALPFVDVPCCAWVVLASTGMPIETLRIAAVTNVAALTAIIAAAALSFRPSTILLTAIASLVSIVAQMVRTELPFVWLPITTLPPLLAAAVGWHVAVRQARRLVLRAASGELARARLGRYFSPAVAERISMQPAAIADHREVTVLISDVRGFTSMSESLEGPAVVATLNEYLELMVGALFK